MSLQPTCTTTEAAAALGISAKVLRGNLDSGFPLLCQPDRESGVWRRLGLVDLARFAVARALIGYFNLADCIAILDRSGVDGRFLKYPLSGLPYDKGFVLADLIGLTLVASRVGGELRVTLRTPFATIGNDRHAPTAIQLDLFAVVRATLDRLPKPAPATPANPSALRKEYA